jgi:hypothetical protein
MNHDLALISAILESGNISEAVQTGIKPKFLGQEAQVYWDGLSEHYEQFQEVPSLDYFQSMYPKYEHNVSSDSIESIAHELKTRYLHSEVDGIIERVAELNLADPWEAQSLLAQLTGEVLVDVQKSNTDLVAGSDKSEVLRRIEFLRQNQGLMGYAWPWEFLNDNSKGVCPGNFIYLYGREKSRKTFLLCFLANWFEKLGLRVLFFTREMTLEEIAWRLYPMRVNLPYKDLTAGQISSDGLLKLEDAMDDLFNRRNLIVTEMDGGMAGVRAKIEEVKPSIVIHDYMMSVVEDEMEMKNRSREHEVIGKVAGAFKRLAMKKKIPIIACGHANRDGVKLKGRSSVEYAGSDKIVRRVDYGFRVITDDANNKTALILNAGRDAKKFLAFTIDSTLCNGFGHFLDADISWVDSLDAAQDGEEKRKEKDKGPPAGTPLSKQAFTTTRGGVTFRR